MTAMFRLAGIDRIAALILLLVARACNQNVIRFIAIDGAMQASS
jgi:hypothetical protein